MTDYTKATNFTSKDSLSTGNPLKIVKGTEIDTEFNNIQTAVASKADLYNPTFTGTTTIATLALTNDLAVTEGGTGGSNATDARTNLSAAKSGANSDITSITGLTTALAPSQGGTGLATLTANNVVLGNGTSAVQFVAPGTASNVLVSNGTTWTSGSAGVTSAVAGNGIAVSGATGAVTISVAAPSFNSIGSYVWASVFNTTPFSITSGSTYTGGTSDGQVRVAGNTISGTWRLMSGSLTTTNYSQDLYGLFVRVS